MVEGCQRDIHHAYCAETVVDEGMMLLRNDDAGRRDNVVIRRRTHVNME